MREGEAQAHRGRLGRVERLVPALGVALRRALRPGPLRHRLQAEDPHPLLLRLREHLRAEAAGVPGGVVDREEDRVEGVALHERRRGLHGVRGEAQETDLARLLRRLEGLHGATGAEDREGVLPLRHRVVLVEVEVVGPHLPQGAVELLRRGLLRPPLGLAREEDALAVGLERGTEHVLGVPVARGHVEVVDARLDRRAHPLGRLLGRRVRHHDPAEADDRELLARLPEGPPLEAARPRLALDPLEARGEEREGRAAPAAPTTKSRLFTGPSSLFPRHRRGLEYSPSPERSPMARMLMIAPDEALLKALRASPLLEGHTIDTVRGEVDALRQLRRRAFDVLITAPDTDLDEDAAILDEVRSLRPGVRIVLLAPKATPDQVIEALRKRVFACFSAPFDAVGDRGHGGPRRRGRALEGRHPGRLRHARLDLRARGLPAPQRGAPGQLLHRAAIRRARGPAGRLHVRVPGGPHERDGARGRLRP